MKGKNRKLTREQSEEKKRKGKGGETEGGTGKEGLKQRTDQKRQGIRKEGRRENADEGRGRRGD